VKLLVISHRASREWNDSCNCHPEWNHAHGGFAMAQVDSVDTVVNWITTQIKLAPDHEFWHGVFYGNALDNIAIQDPYTDKSWQSIEVYGETHDSEIAWNMQEDIKRRVSGLLTEHAKEEATRAARERANAVAIAERQRVQDLERGVERDRAELERLKKKLGEA
jgi:hypothetical protein